MNYKQLIAHFGSQAEVARALGISQPSVWEWRRNGIPDERQLELEKLTKGQLKADRFVVERFKALLPGEEAA